MYFFDSYSILVEDNKFKKSVDLMYDREKKMLVQTCDKTEVRFECANEKIGRVGLIYEAQSEKKQPIEIGEEETIVGLYGSTRNGFIQSLGLIVYKKQNSPI